MQRRVDSVSVLDPTFNADNARAMDMLDLIIKESRRHPGCHFHFEARAELLTPGQVKRFAQLNCSLQIGLQTFTPQAAAHLDRGYNKEKFLRGVHLLNQYGIHFGLDLIYGLPGDTYGGFRQSLDRALGLYPDNLDIFPLALLPGTTLSDRAAELGIRAAADAPYLVESTATFSAADMRRAAELAGKAEIFYNKGRAVAWFLQVLHPLKAKPAAFLERYDGGPIEAYVAEQYRRAGKQHLIPAVTSLIAYHTAWGRALAEGAETTLTLHYDPEALLSEDAMDLEYFVENYRQRKATYTMDSDGELH
jgi:radical SAM superfamily enzyme YgiQ (UPF0313 family)